MKKLNYLFSVGILLGLLVVTGCGSDDGGDPDVQADQLAKLAKTWVVDTSIANDNAVTQESEPKADLYEDFTLTITDNKGYTTTNSESASVWPESGSWEFEGESITKILRDSAIPVDLVLNSDATSLKLTFVVPTSAGGRGTGVDGTWVFNMVAQ